MDTVSDAYVNYKSHEACGLEPQISGRIRISQSRRRQPFASCFLTSFFGTFFLSETAVGGAILKEKNKQTKRIKRQICNNAVLRRLSRK